MSRGHGSVQRRVLDRLAGHAADYPPSRDRFDLGRQCFDSFATVASLADGESRSARESVRRAVLALEAEGIVEVLHVRHGPRMHLCARLMPTADEAADWQANWDEYQDARRSARAAVGW